MLEKIVTLGSILGMGFAVLFWAQATFVSAADFQQVQSQNLEDKIYTLIIKQEELKKQGKDLDSWEKAELDRARQRLRQIKN